MLPFLEGHTRSHPLARRTATLCHLVKTIGYAFKVSWRMPYSDAAVSLARRRVVEGEARIVRMQALIAAAVERGQSAGAIRVLDTMIVTVAIMVDQEHMIEAEHKRRNAFKPLGVGGDGAGP